MCVCVCARVRVHEHAYLGHVSPAVGGGGPFQPSLTVTQPPKSNSRRCEHNFLLHRWEEVRDCGMLGVRWAFQG